MSLQANHLLYVSIVWKLIQDTPKIMGSRFISLSGHILDLEDTFQINDSNNSRDAAFNCRLLCITSKGKIMIMEK